MHAGRSNTITWPSAAQGCYRRVHSGRSGRLKFVEENLDPSIKFKLVLCAVDEKLNDKCYIVPGLGDAGDRLYGVID